ncbi:hypothetical protein MAPG_00283 [Magnaporthiopsis poae ATCC 64411]|uniref:Uncharacterized protein n=1 Tax=Magnaporthiopsis poae (strain ATCC 64411 / 73-15) TaxID=644358 RepID=A0A0C4DKK8_MAGP6|nr:hypothetical protein MAPG_00283 [Magnaporthiopsis poae ATCC 64411]
MESYKLNLENQHPNTIKIVDQFNVYRVPYKHVNNHPIYAFFVIPKVLPAGPRPLMEGGAQAALTSVASTAGAIVLDAPNVIVVGESGGGYHTAQVALLGMTSLPIKCLIIQYPALRLAEKMREEFERKEGSSRPFWPEKVPYSVVEEHLAGLEPGHVCARAPFATRMDLLAAMMQAGKFADLEGDNAYLDPWVSLETAGKLPPILLYHSKEDEAVPWEHTDEWATKLKKLQPDVPLHLSFQTGPHVFDVDHTVDAPWLKEPLEFVSKYWPA